MGISIYPVVDKDAIESNVCSHKKEVSNLFGILSKGNSWIDLGDDIDSLSSLSG